MQIMDYISGLTENPVNNIILIMSELNHLW